MILEVREYVAVPGRMPALIEFFTNHTVRMFERYGLTMVGAGQTLIGDNAFGELIYTMRFADLSELERQWGQVMSDTEWQHAFADAEGDGPLIQTMRRRVIDATPFEPAT